MTTPQPPARPEWQKTKRTEWVSTAGVPEWVFALSGQFADDPIRLRIACERARAEHSTEADRAASRAFKLGPSYPCTNCQRHAFSSPRLCYWCEHGHTAPMIASHSRLAPTRPSRLE